MEPLSDVERKSSFNPEAAAFSPTAAEQGQGSVAAIGDTESSSSFSMVPDPSSNSLLRLEDMNTTKLDLSRLAPVPMRLEEFLSRGLPLDLGTQAFEESTTASAQGTTSSPYHKYIHSQSGMNAPISVMPNFTLSPQQIEPDFHVVEMDELSASLGLPSAKKGTKSNNIPVRAHRLRTPQGTPSALYGKLINKALDKPMTADALAQYMKSRSEESKDTVKAYQDSQEAFVRDDTQRHEHEEALRIVRPPPGFPDQTPRMVTVEDKPNLTGPTTMEQNIAHATISGYLHQHRFDHGQPTTPLRLHRRLSRHPRVHGRTKRTDQGPEPSAADIYPDDAHWMPTRPVYQKHFASIAYMAPPPQAIVRVEDAASWPTPAEVYTHETQAPPVAHVPQDINIFEAHIIPTADDLSAADGNVLSLLEELPDPAINTLIHFGELDLVADERSLSPCQKSGKRYGLAYFGIGIKDEWRPPRVAETDPFRVRPRDHQGWGGWEWAIKKGWADA